MQSGRSPLDLEIGGNCAKACKSVMSGTITRSESDLIAVNKALKIINEYRYHQLAAPSLEIQKFSAQEESVKQQVFKNNIEFKELYLKHLDENESTKNQNSRNYEFLLWMKTLSQDPGIDKTLNTYPASLNINTKIETPNWHD